MVERHKFWVQRADELKKTVEPQIRYVNMMLLCNILEKTDLWLSPKVQVALAAARVTAVRMAGVVRKLHEQLGMDFKLSPQWVPLEWVPFGDCSLWPAALHVKDPRVDDKDQSVCYHSSSSAFASLIDRCSFR